MIAQATADFLTAAEIVKLLEPTFNTLQNGVSSNTNAINGLSSGVLNNTNAINNNGDAISSLESKLPKTCAGQPATNVVACEEFNGLFSAAFANQDLCIPIADVAASCGPQVKLVGIETSPGCYALGRVPAGDLCYGVVFNTGTDIFPSDTAPGTSELYAVEDLAAAHAAGTIDQALLDNSCTAEGEITVPCDDTYTFATTNTVILTDAYLGTGQFAITVDGQLLTNAAGQLVFSDVFTNQAGNFSEQTWTGYLTAGTHTIKRHLLATVNGSVSTAQIARAVGTTEVCKKDA